MGGVSHISPRRPQTGVKHVCRLRKGQQMGWTTNLSERLQSEGPRIRDIIPFRPTPKTLTSATFGVSINPTTMSPSAFPGLLSPSIILTIAVSHSGSRIYNQLLSKTKFQDGRLFNSFRREGFRKLVFPFHGQPSSLLSLGPENRLGIQGTGREKAALP